MYGKGTRARARGSPLFFVLMTTNPPNTWNRRLPIEVFRKADAPRGRRARIRGIASVEDEDRHGDITVQDGIDFRPFLSYGFFNDEHDNSAVKILGYPERVYQVTLTGRDGKPVKATMVEGYLIPCKDTDALIERARALKAAGSPRRYGLSVEGGIVERDGPGERWDPTKKDPLTGTQGTWIPKRITKSVVRNVAITPAPVHADTEMEILAKALTAGHGQPQAGAEVSGDLRPMMPESLDGGPPKPQAHPAVTLPIYADGPSADLWRRVAETEHEWLVAQGFAEPLPKDRLKKSLADVRERFPGASPRTGARILRLAQAKAGA